GRLAARQLELDAAAGDRRRTEERLGERKQQLDQARGRLDTLRAEYANLKGRKASLDDVLAHRSYATSPVRRLFEVLERGRNHDFRLLGILADFIEVDPGFEKSAEEFLHDELDFVVVETWDQAARGLELLRGEADGRATFLVHPEKGAHAPAALPEPETGAGTGLTAKLSDSLRLTNGLRERATGLLPRISRCFLAEDHARARELAIEYPHLYFLLPDGAFYHGHTLTGGKKTASGPLAIKREARELVLALEAGERELRATTEQVNGLTQEVESLESELARLRDLQQEREKSALALEHEMRKMAEEAGRNQSRLSVARMDLERLRQEGERAIEQLGRSRQEVEERESLKAGREQALEAGRLALETLAAQAAAAAEEHSALRVELAGLEERGRGERTAMARLAAERNEVAGRHARIGPEIERLKAERARLLAENATLEGASADLAARIAGSEDEVGRLAWQEAQARDQLLAGEAALKQHREGMLELQQKRSEIEIELVKRQAELGYLDETSRKELGREIREVAASLGTVPEAETMVAAEQGHREIREKIEALGPVNPEAMNEYQEAQQRQDFLSSQRQDLLDSIRDTEKALEEIDRVSRQKFADAFEAIN
ncbi:MAG: chromosome segregation protein SMC, partial [Acidobacteria bacterium]|nr:chromosome segregation protein SMC [Acidobacteriota bacterium]